MLREELYSVGRTLHDCEVAGDVDEVAAGLDAVDDVDGLSLAFEGHLACLAGGACHSGDGRARGRRFGIIGFHVLSGCSSLLWLLRCCFVRPWFQHAMAKIRRGGWGRWFNFEKLSIALMTSRAKLQWGVM